MKVLRKRFMILSIYLSHHPNIFIVEKYFSFAFPAEEVSTVSIILYSDSEKVGDKDKQNFISCLIRYIQIIFCFSFLTLKCYQSSRLFHRLLLARSVLLYIYIGCCVNIVYHLGTISWWIDYFVLVKWFLEKLNLYPWCMPRSWYFQGYFFEVFSLSFFLFCPILLSSACYIFPEL